jgi:hypothetical protein
MVGQPDWKVRTGLFVTHWFLRFTQKMCELEDDQRCYPPVSTMVEIVGQLRQGGTTEIEERWI